MLEGEGMTDFNYKGVAYFVIIALLLLAGLVVVAVHAEDANATGSYAIVDSPVYPIHEPYRITQGEDVYVNDTIDIAGQGWGSGIAWYGKYQESDVPRYIYQFTPYKHDVQNFWLNPAIFEGKSGVWYQYYGNNTERNGNLEAFRIVNAYRNTSWTFPNGTTMLASEGLWNETNVTPLPKTTILPEIPVSDFVIAHGDPLPTNFTKLWVFGRVDSIYNSTGNLTKEQILSLSDGWYKIVYHEAGNNTIYEVGYDAVTKTFTSPWKNVQDVSIYGSQPMLDVDRFYSMIRGTDDQVKTFNLDIEEPSISVVSIDEVDVGNRIPIAYEPGMTLLDVRGYSNVQNDTLITVVMDPDKQTVRTLKANTWPAHAIKTSAGNKSMYQVYIPINKNQMPNGMHTVLVTTVIGGSMRYDFMISELPADSFIPNATLKYIGDSNPWKPNLTVLPAVTIPIPVPGPVQTIREIITPSPEQIKEAAQKIVNEQNRANESVAVVVIVSLIALGFIGWFLYSIWRGRGK